MLEWLYQHGIDPTLELNKITIKHDLERAVRQINAELAEKNERKTLTHNGG